jgi:hypothetical protein
MKIAELIPSSTSFHDMFVNLLSTIPDDEVLTGKEIGERFGVDPNNRTIYSVFAKYPENRLKVRVDGKSAWVYGSEAAIQKLQNRLPKGNQ